MNLEIQVCSLELAKSLKKIGVEQDSSFFHYNEPYNDGEDCFVITDWSDYLFAYSNKSEPYSAFTAPELFEILPNSIDTKQNEPFNNFRFIMERSFIVEKDITEIERIFVLNYLTDTFIFDKCHLPITRLLAHNIWDKSLPNALAKLLIYLVENKLIEVFNKV